MDVCRPGWPCCHAACCACCRSRGCVSCCSAVRAAIAGAAWLAVARSAFAFGIACPMLTFGVARSVFALCVLSASRAL
eukprot:334410-Chlamydomonas_euryale.AAC.1